MSRTISPTEREAQSSPGEPEQAGAEVVNIGGGVAGTPPPHTASMDTGRVPAQMRERGDRRRGETIGRGGQRDGHEGRQIDGERGAGERVPSPLLFIAAIDRGVCALIQVDHLLELDKRARAWALCCHSWRAH